MDDEHPTPELIDFLHQAISCCRSNASYEHVPDFARQRLREASDNVAFFLQQNEHARAFHEARTATTINSAVARYIQTCAAALGELRDGIGE